VLTIKALDGKDLVIPANPVKFTDKNCGVVDFKKAPELGEHSVEILKEYGYSDEEIKIFMEKGITSRGEQK
jgi:crotonobetainyl-CoA:carnitine CoA-transferase CaiB-like acyl-CoA transferase